MPESTPLTREIRRVSTRREVGFECFGLKGDEGERDFCEGFEEKES